MAELPPGIVVEPSGQAVTSSALAATFRELFEAHHAYVFHSLRRLGVPERDLPDLTHDVFVVVHRKLASYDACRPARPWLLAIGARVAADYRRLARHRREQIGSEREAADPALPPDAGLAASEAQAMLIEALDAVDESRRALLVLVEIDEVSVPEAAAALELPLNTAYSRLRKGRAELAAAAARLRAKRGWR